MTDENDDETDKPTNPIIERGLVLSPPEYELISKILTGCAQESDKRGHPQVRQRIMAVVGRMRHAVQAGQGLSPEQAARYQKDLHEAFRTGDQYKLGEVVENLIATTLRLEPDPAGTVAAYLMQMLGQVIGGHARVSVVVLEQLDKQLGDADTDWNATDKWPKPKALLQWVRDLIDVGVQNLKMARDPWPEE